MKMLSGQIFKGLLEIYQLAIQEFNQTEESTNLFCLIKELNRWI